MTLQQAYEAASPRERSWWNQLRLPALVAVLVPFGLLLQGSIAHHPFG